MNIRVLLKHTKLLLVAFLLSIFWSMSGAHASALTQEQILRNKNQQIQEQLEAKQQLLEKTQGQVDTLEARLTQADNDINIVQAAIAESNLKIKQTETEIATAEKDLVKQKESLKASLRQLYMNSDTSWVVAIAASNSFNDYIDSQKNLGLLKDHVTDSVKKVEALKAKLVAQKEQLLQDKDELGAKKVALDNVRFQRALLLKQTQGQQAKYEAQVANLQEQRDSAEAELNNYLARLAAQAQQGTLTSYGNVQPGDVIGYMGNTGYSTGTHVHFAVRSGGVLQDPVAIINAEGWTWPVSGGGGYVTQNFGCVPNSFYANAGCPAGWSFHDGLDVAASTGTPLLAPASGQIIHRGCLYVGTVFATFMVIIQIGNYQVSYAHMMAPNDPGYSGCNSNTFTGELSVY